MSSIDNNNAKPSLDTQSAVSTSAETNVEVEQTSIAYEIVQSDKQLEEILFGIRTLLAERSHCMVHFVASDMAIGQMVKKKPVSIEEFRAFIIDQSIAKIQKFASAFIYGIIKFMDNELSLDKVLRIRTLEKEQPQLDAGTRCKLQKLIKNNKSIGDIQKALNLSENQVIHEIVILIRSGLLITKAHLYFLVGVDDGIFNYIKELATEDDMHSLDNLDVVKAKFCSKTKITEQMLILVLNYLKVRRFLMQINVPYFDVDDNKLVNGNALLKSAAKSAKPAKPAKRRRVKRLKPIRILCTRVLKPYKRIPRIVQYLSDPDDEDQAEKSPQSKRIEATATAAAKKFPVKRRDFF